MSRKKKVNVPIILQMEEMEGGAACLTMILAYYRKWLKLDEVRVACGMSRDGLTIQHIKKGAESFHLNCREENYSLEELKTKADLPVILLWKKKQFVVLEGFRGKNVFLNHPGKGQMKLSEEAFEKSYSGTCLLFSPDNEFEPGGEKKTLTAFLKKVLKKNTKTIVLITVTGFLAAIGGILAPVFSRIFTDDILSGFRTSWYPGILYGFGAVILFMLLASVIHSILITRSTGKLAVSSNASYMRHILRLPMEFFSRRRAGDLANRQDANDAIAETLVSELAPLLINILMLIFYLTVMIQYSLLLTGIGVATIIINLLIARKVGIVRREISATQFRNQASLDSATVSGIDMMDSIKATGSESGYFERWSGFHASVIKAQVRFNDVAKYLLTLPSLIQELSDCIVLFLGFLLIIKGHFTAGLLLAFLQFMKSLMDPVNDLLDAGENLQEMNAQVERVDDVMDYPEEVFASEDDENLDFEQVRKLSGNVEMKHITYGYSKFADPIIQDFSLTLTPGKRVALVGGSGSGKSTIAKLLAGLQKPWSGEILFDGKRIDEIPRALFKGSLTMVDQEITLFHDTVDNNIRMWDSSIEDYEIRLAARDAGIHDFIMSNKEGYHLMLQEGGKNLSGGERQRMEIARVLACDPSIIILDEATSALDAHTEYKISEYIQDRGITCIIVAHRLSTIRDCDEIIVLDHGDVVQRGTHEELIQTEGLYKDLITTA